MRTIHRTVEPPARALTDILDRTLCGCVIIDAGAEPLHWNRTAASLLGHRHTAKGGELDCVDRRMVTELLRAHGNVVRVEMESWFIAHAPNGRDSELLVHLLPCRDSAHAVLIMIDLNDIPCPTPDALRHIFRLTRSEARVARLLCSGKSLEEVAEALGTKVGTARKHLAAMFEKTGTSRQAELVARLIRVATLP